MSFLLPNGAVPICFVTWQTPPPHEVSVLLPASPWGVLLEDAIFWELHKQAWT